MTEKLDIRLLNALYFINTSFFQTILFGPNLQYF